VRAFGILVLLGLLASSAAPAADKLLLAQGGRARAQIQIAPDASVPLKSTAVELADYLERITGATFEVTSARPAGARIVLGRLDQFPDLKLTGELKDMNDEAFLIRTDGNALLLLGKSDVAASHAAFAFLEDLGCRWFFPTPEWEIVPRVAELTVQADRRDAPQMIVRGMWYGTMNGYMVENHLLRDWNRRNRVPRSQVVTSHSWIGLDPKKDFEEHPEYFALVKGKRKASKPCYSHPDVVRRAIDYALKRAEEGAKSVTVSAPDGLDFCECERCYAVYQGGLPFVDKLALFARRPDGTLVCATSETIFRMTNEVARAVRARYPDVLIGVMAYSGYSHPPSFDFEPNVYVQITTSYRRTPMTLEEQIEAFGRKARQIGLYDYYHIAVWYGFRPDKGIKIARLKERMPYYIRNNVRGIWAESTNNWAAAGPDFYVAHKLMWNPDADADALYRDFLVKCFGRAFEPMKRYYDRWEAATEMNEASLGAALADLAEAWRLDDSPAVRARVGMLYLYMRAMRAGARYAAVKNDDTKSGPPGKEYADLVWRMQNGYLLHDLVSKSANRPMPPAFSRNELEAMMAEDVAGR